MYGPAETSIEQINTSTGTVLYLHHDQQGSTRLITGSAGKTEATFTYGACGELTGHTGTATTPLGYDGQYTSSDTGLIYLRNRVYYPTTAQFLSLASNRSRSRSERLLSSRPSSDTLPRSARANNRRDLPRPHLQRHILQHRHPATATRKPLPHPPPAATPARPPRETVLIVGFATAYLGSTHRCGRGPGFEPLSIRKRASCSC
jgi:RHS repeat-associated protein